MGLSGPIFLKSFMPGFADLLFDECSHLLPQNWQSSFRLSLVHHCGVQVNFKLVTLNLSFRPLQR